MTLKEYLTENNLNLTEFSRASRVPVSALSRLLAGERGLSLKSALRVQAATGNVVAIDTLQKAGNGS